MSAQTYSAPGLTEGRWKAFLEWTSIDLSSKLSLGLFHKKSKQGGWGYGMSWDIEEIASGISRS